MCCLLVGRCCRHFHGSWEWRRGGSAGGLCVRGVLDEADLKTIKIRKLFLIPTIISNANWLWVWLLFL